MKIQITTHTGNPNEKDETQGLLARPVSNKEKAKVKHIVATIGGTPSYQNFTKNTLINALRIFGGCVVAFHNLPNGKKQKVN